MPKVYNRDGQCDPIQVSKPYGEWTRRNKDKRKPMCGPKGLDKVAGDGRFGFPSRRPVDPRITAIQLESGEYHRAARKTACRPRKRVNRLVTVAACTMAVRMTDPEVQKSVAKNAKRRHRNEKRANQRTKRREANIDG